MKCKFCNFNIKKIENTIIEETDNFWILPSVGSLVKGYLLIVTKKHINSMSELEENEKKEYEAIIKKYRRLFKKVYNKFPIVFEHGSPDKENNIKANSIVHAHTHIVNHNFFNEGNIIKELNFREIPNLNYLTKEKNYIMYINQDGICYVTNKFKPISQIMRKLVAKDLGYENKFDWKNEKFIENIKETIKDIQN